jgi:hypothetical protein
MISKARVRSSSNELVDESAKAIKPLPERYPKSSLRSLTGNAKTAVS